MKLCLLTRISGMLAVLSGELKTSPNQSQSVSCVSAASITSCTIKLSDFVNTALGDTGWASGCILSDKYRFVFIHVLKSGGTAVKKFIKESLCEPDDHDCSRAPKSLVRAEGCIKSIRDHQDYFHFSFVRNPYSRIFSAYRYVCQKSKWLFITCTIHNLNS